ncbi:MAG: hypothetical protein SF051_14595 [Elusimicrobiota bacterium]|nr:hypothetical protein [Elusimicrobiota bacterium]
MMPGCGEISRRLSEARDSGRRLTATERLHLWVCAVCRRLKLQLETVASAAAQPPRAGPILPEATKARLRRLLGG